jgi:hypothetical protein
MACYTYKGKTYTKEELLAIKNQIIAENEAVFNQMGSEALNDVNVLVDQLVKNGLAEEVIVENTQTLLDVLDEAGVSEGLKRQFTKGAQRQITVFRGIGNNVSLPDNANVLWVAEDEEVAKNYAGINEDGSTNIEKIEVEKPINSIEMPYKLATEVTASNIGNNLRAIAEDLYRSKKISDEKISDCWDKI